MRHVCMRATAVCCARWRSFIGANFREIYRSRHWLFYDGSAPHFILLAAGQRRPSTGPKTGPEGVSRSREREFENSQSRRRIFTSSGAEIPVANVMRKLSAARFCYSNGSINIAFLSRWLLALCRKRVRVGTVANASVINASKARISLQIYIYFQYT